MGASATQPGGDRNLLRRAVVPVFADLGCIDVLVRQTRAEAVTVLPSALIPGDELRRLAWRVKRSGAELFVCTGLTEIAGNGYRSARPASRRWWPWRPPGCPDRLESSRGPSTDALPCWGW